MIVRLMGTGGAGKSYLVQAVMGKYVPGGLSTIYREGRVRPIGYALNSLDSVVPKLFVPGHYETPCGGCDTIKTPDEVDLLVRNYHEANFNVLYEGVIVADDTRRAVALHEEFGAEFAAVLLDTPVAECLVGIQARRDARGDTRVLNPKNTVDRATRMRRHYEKLQAAGVRTSRFENRDAALAEVLRLLGHAA